MNYPGKVIKKGCTDRSLVKSVQRRLNLVTGSKLLVDGDFGSKTQQAVKSFQALHRDQNGNPLEIDGMVGAITWYALFGATSIPIIETTTNKLLEKVVAIAIKELGVMEDPPGSNLGKRVEEYQVTCGIGKGSFWCAAFVYWCFNEAAKALERSNPVLKTGGCMYHWNKTTAKKVGWKDAYDKPSLIKPGYIFIINTGGYSGHTGIVEKVEGGYVHTIEGNSNTSGSRNGIGVFRNKRKIVKINRGFINYS
ncbi:MAG: CHAP domain-containing protein [Niabella sp.]